MANPKFKIGDKVKIHSGRGVECIAYVSGMDAYCGETAIIRNVIKSCAGTRIFYELMGIPYSWHESLLEAVNNESKVVITTDGTITRAAMYDGHKLIKEAFSTCSKEEAFDFEKGAKIAFERLTAKPAEPKPKKELKPLDTKIFVLDGDDILKSSHIYEVKNGKIRAFIGSYPSKGTLYNMTDVVNYLKPSSQRNGEEKYDSNGVKLSVYDNRKQITVMEVKEG
jgi:hypothetical protein